MRVLVRADASESIGTGHVMRCLTLAGRLREQGATVSFVCRAHPGHLGSQIEQEGFELHLLPTAAAPQPWPAEAPAAGWLGALPEIDAQQTAAALGGARADLLVVDHYAIEAGWESHLRPHAGQIMVLDDLADRPHDCDVLLDQNLTGDAEARYRAHVPAQARLLLGPRYALLRPEFPAARRRLARRNGRASRLLIFFGGSDPTEETEKALAALALMPSTRLEADVVVGATNPRRAEIEARCAALASVRFHCQVKDMASLMLEADLALGAGGSTCWERCCLGLPAILVAVAANQVPIAEACAREGVAHYLGLATDLTVERMHAALATLMDASDRLRAMESLALALVDGHGAARVVASLSGPQEARA